MQRFLLPALLIFTSAALRAEDPVKIVKKDNTLEFRVGDQLVSKYQFAGTVKVEKGDGDKPLAKPFFYPVFAPGNIPVTRAWPMDRTNPETTDHFHQKSIWFCHGDVIPEGIELKDKPKGIHGVDFWSEGAGHGRIVCIAQSEPKQVAANHAQVTTLNQWQTKDGVKILDEVRTIHFSTTASGRLFVLEIDLHANVCPITFGDTKEGSMGIRVNDTIRLNGKGTGVITSSAGDTIKSPAKDNLAVWGKTADWHDYSGEINGKTAGIAVFDDSNNKIRASWHTRAYGLMAANPFGRDKSFPSQKGNAELVKLAKGEHLKLRYGIYIHAGDAAAGKVADVYKTFSAKGL